MSEKLKTCLAGSFKFKPEIDLLHDEFTDLGVEVLEPSKGWLILPRFEATNGYRPLPSEENLNLKEIETRFLNAIRKSNFLYVCNFEGYIGGSTELEIGYAFADRTPIFSREPMRVPLEDIGDTFEYVAGFIQVASPSEVVKIMSNQ